MPHFHIITLNADGDFISQHFQTEDAAAAFEVRGFRPTGKVAGAPLRRELRGQPILEGLAGPMWGGERDGVPIVRYESQPARRALSA